MEKLFENEFVVFTYEKDAQLLVFSWKHTDKLTESGFREILSKQRSAAIENSTKAIIVNTLNFEFTIAPATQEWVASKVVSKWFEVGVRKVAFVVTADLFAQVSIEQVWTEEAATTLKPRYFDNLEAARKWVLS